MKRIVTGIMFGSIAGVLDVIPMILQKLSFDTDISAFCMWVVSGFLVSVINIKVHYLIKGVIVPFCVALPALVLIGWKEPFNLIPIGIMTVILGLGLGFAVEKWNKAV